MPLGPSGPLSKVCSINMSDKKATSHSVVSGDISALPDGHLSAFEASAGLCWCRLVATSMGRAWRNGRTAQARADDVRAACRRAVIPALLLMVAAVTRLYRLDGKSLWLDEAFSVFVAGQPLNRMMEIIVQHDTPPPLYYALLHFWLALGNDPFTARLLSVLFGIATAGAAWSLGHVAAGKREATVAGLLVAISPLLVWYGQEARMYALLCLLCSLSAIFLLLALRTSQARYGALYVAATVLAMYTQASALFFVLAEACAALIFLVWPEKDASVGNSSPPSVRRHLRSWLLSQAAVALLWLPWLPSFLRQSEIYKDFWIPAPNPDSVVTLFFELTSAYLPHWRLSHSREVLVAAAVGVILSAVLRSRSRERLFLLQLVIVPTIGMYLASQFKPIFISRALIYISVPYLVLLACGICGLAHWKLAMPLLAALLLLLNSLSLYRLYMVQPKEEWELAASYITSRATSGELVLFLAADAQIPFDYYAGADSKRLERRGLPADVLSVPPLEPKVRAQDLPRIRSLIADHPSFWLVESHSEFADPQGLVRQIIAESWESQDRRQFYGITVERLRRATRVIKGQAELVTVERQR